MRLDSNRRRQLKLLSKYADRIARSLDREWLDDATPTLEPSLDQARDAAARLRVAVGELELIAEMEHAR